jgi:hypothetical protein
MIQIEIENSINARIRQGDMLKHVEMVEYVSEEIGVVEVSKILFPYVVVLTQDCDLEQEFNSRDTISVGKNDKCLMSVIVAPLYNCEHFLVGEHLSNLKLEMQKFTRNKTPHKIIIQNNNPRYHYIEFPNTIQISPQVIDFKHYFTCNLAYLEQHKTKNFICSISILYRELLSQRFSNFLSRIGLPSLQPDL